MKGITSIIGVIILLLIVVGLGGTAYSYISDLVQGPASKTIQLAIGSMTRTP